MKHISRNKKSFLWQALLASTLITVVSPPAYAVLVDITVSGKNSDDAGFDPAGGYNYKADDISFTVTDGDNIGTTLVVAVPTSVDNNTGVVATPWAKSVLNFTGSSIVLGAIGTTNPIESISLQGINKTVQFDGDIKLSKGITLELVATDGTINFADNVDVTGFIDNKIGASKGKIEFQGTGTVSGSIGGTNAFQLLTVNSNGNNLETVTLLGPVNKATTFLVNDSATVGQGTILQFNNIIGQITGNITAKTNNIDTVDFINAVSMTGNIGTNATGFAKVMVGANDELALTGNIFSTLTQFQADNTLTLSDGNTITGNVDTTVASTGILEFTEAGGVTGTIGATNAINQVIMNGAGKTVSLGGDVKVTNGVNFSGAADTTSVLNLADGVDITGNLDNKTALSAGIVNFAGEGGVSGTTGATKAINTINLKGGAGKTVEFDNNVTVGSGNLNFAAGSTATSVLKFNPAATLTVTGNIDNTTGTANIGTINFEKAGIVTGTVGATKSINIINLKGAGTVQFNGNVTASVTNITAAGTAEYADNVIVTGAIDNTGAPNTGQVQFVGGGTVTGSIGATNLLNLLTLNSLSAGSNETITLTGTIVNATTIAVKDDGATPTTLVLNNPAMAVTGNITAETNNVNILNVLNAATITGQIGAGGAAFNLMKVAQNGNTKVDGDIFANTLQFNGNNSLTLTDNSDITGNVTTTMNNQGILQLEGTTNITGTIGSAGLALNAINLLGFNETLKIGDDTFASNINIANDGTVIIEDGESFTGNINNSSGVASKGKLTFEGTGSVAGNIGATNTLNLITINSTSIANAIVTLTGNVVRATQIDVKGATTTIKLDNGAMVLTTTNGILSKTAFANTFDINKAALINSNIGAAGSEFLLVKVGAIGNTTINGDIFATTTQFQADNILTLTDGSDVEFNIDSLGGGKLVLAGDHIIKGTVGATNSLTFINVTGANKTVNFQSDVKAGSVNFSGVANCATKIILADGVDITGNVDNTTGSSSAGTLNFAGDGSVSGTIGATNGLCQINLQGAAGKLVTFGNDTKVGSGNINFLNDSTLNIANKADITGNIDTDAASQGTLNFIGDSVVNGIVGLSNELKLVNLSGAGSTVNFNQNVNTDVMLFTAGGTAALASGITVSGAITTTANNQGNVNFLGNFNIKNQIGAPGLALNSINVNGASGTTVNLFEDIYAANTNVTAGGTLFAKDVATIMGNVNLTAASGSTLAVASNATPLTITGDLNVPNGTVLQFDLSSISVPTYIKVNNAAFIDANSTVVLTNTPQAYAAGNYDIKLVDAGAVGNINVPLNVNGDSLLLTFELEAQNAPNNDLLLHIDVNPASIYANRINTRGVAGALDAMAGKDFLGSLQQLLDQLPYFTTVEQLNDHLAALAPIVDNSFTQETFAAQQLGFGAVSDRLRHVRQRKVIPGMKAPFESGFSSGDDWDENGHGRWFKLYGQYSDQDERTQVDGYNAETWGVAIGSDVSLNDLNLIGVSANLSHTYIGHDVSDSTTSLYSLQGAIYGEQDFCEWFYFNWVTSVAYNKYTTERNFLFGLLPFSPKADFIGWQFGAKGEFGYEYLYQGLHIIPNTSLYYSYLALNGYNESGAGTASQSVEDQNYSMLKGGVGVRAAYNCPYNMGDRRSIIFQPEIRVNMFYDFINDNMHTTSQFTGGGPSFVTVGPTPAATSYNVGASLSVFSDYSPYIITMSYDFETKHDYTANAGFLRMRYEW